jgi:hypothetical protein
MLALAAREAVECRRCGGDLAETTDYANRYLPLPPLVCLRCQALHEADEQHSKHPQHAGMIQRVARHDRPQPKKRARRKRG